MSNNIRMIYASNAVNGVYTNHDVWDILKQSRIDNPKHNITGLLLANETSLLQVLEGDQAAIEFLVRRIDTDPRHKNVVVICEEDISARRFSNWITEFHRFTGEESAFSRDWTLLSREEAIKLIDAALVTLETATD